MDWLENQSTTALRNVGRKGGRGRSNQWEEIARKARFYAQEEETIVEALDVREATREMKDMDID